jgi:hypothetical protein
MVLRFFAMAAPEAAPHYTTLVQLGILRYRDASADSSSFVGRKSDQGLRTA